MAIKTYTRADAQTKLGKHWTVGELWLDDSMTKLVLDDKLIDMLDKVADRYGVMPRFATKRSVYCTSGHASGSYHYKGMAADIYVPGITPLELAQFAEEIGAGGIGVYEGWDVKGKHIHIDTRSSRTCWWVLTTGSKTPGFGANTVYKQGHRSPYLILVQRALGISADGVFGAQTDAAVRKYQSGQGLKADGIIGQQTLKTLGLR